MNLGMARYLAGKYLEVLYHGPVPGIQAGISGVGSRLKTTQEHTETHSRTMFGEEP